MPKIVTLTDAQASALETYLFVTTRYRQNEGAACESLSRELDASGQPRYPKMQGNARWWEKMDQTIEEIVDALRNAEYSSGRPVWMK